MFVRGTFPRSEKNACSLAVQTVPAHSNSAAVARKPRAANLNSAASRHQILPRGKGTSQPYWDMTNNQQVRSSAKQRFNGISQQRAAEFIAGGSLRVNRPLAPHARSIYDGDCKLLLGPVRSKHPYVYNGPFSLPRHRNPWGDHPLRVFYRCGQSQPQCHAR